MRVHIQAESCAQFVNAPARSVRLCKLARAKDTQWLENKRNKMRDAMREGDETIVSRYNWLSQVQTRSCLWSSDIPRADGPLVCKIHRGGKCLYTWVQKRPTRINKKKRFEEEWKLTLYIDFMPITLCVYLVIGITTYSISYMLLL